MISKSLFRNVSGWNLISAVCIGRNPGQQLFLNLELHNGKVPVLCQPTSSISSFLIFKCPNILNLRQLRVSSFSEQWRCTQKLLLWSWLDRSGSDWPLGGSGARRGQNVPINVGCKTNTECQKAAERTLKLLQIKMNDQHQVGSDHSVTFRMLKYWNDLIWLSEGKVEHVDGSYLMKSSLI